MNYETGPRDLKLCKIDVILDFEANWRRVLFALLESLSKTTQSRRGGGQKEDFH